MINVKIAVEIDGSRVCGLTVTDKASEEDRTLMLCRFFAQMHELLTLKRSRKEELR